MPAANDPEARAAVEAVEAPGTPAFQEQETLEQASPERARAPLKRAPLKGEPRSTVIFGVVAAAVTLLGGGVFLAKSRTRPPVAPVPVVAATVAALPASGAPAAPPQSAEVVPVRFTNPFDKTEVFEFPPGTSDIEARDAVAELLAQRARERHIQLTKPARRNSKTADRNTPVTATRLTPHS